MVSRKKSTRKAGAAPSRTIAFQGQLGAYSHLACRQYFPDMVPLPTAAFEDTF
ncbi:MAG: prephenate dehydratase, partial [Alphaproteobacteria bacterium]